MKKVLVSLSQFGGYPGDPLKELKDKGYDVVLNPHGRKLTEGEVSELAAGCAGILAGLEPLNKNVLEKLPELKVISRAGIGVDNIDLGFAREKNIQILITPDAIKQSVVELTIGAVLALLRKIPQADKLIREGKWTRLKGVQVAGKTVGVVGLGRIGKGVAEAFLSLGARVIASDLQPDEAWAQSKGIFCFQLQKLLEEADIVTLHVPSLAGGKALIGEKEMSAMRKGSFLANLSRGGVVDEEALVKFLQNGHLAGAALDVFSKEPYNGPLTGLENVVLTAHMGSHTSEARQKMEIDAARQMMNALEKGG